MCWFECTAWWIQLKKLGILLSKSELPVLIGIKGTAIENALFMKFNDSNNPKEGTMVIT
jgi:hypothetical protein